MFNIEKAYGSAVGGAMDKGFISPALITNPVINPLAEMLKGLEHEVVKDAEKKISPVKFYVSDKVKQMIMESSTKIERVIFNNPVTVVLWADGTKTKVRAQAGDTYNKETGLAMCIAKKVLGNTGSFNEVFKQWIPEYGKPEVTVYVENKGSVVCHESTGGIRKLSQKEAKEVKARFKKR